MCIMIIIRTLGSLQNHVALFHWPKFWGISQPETQFIGTAEASAATTSITVCAAFPSLLISSVCTNELRICFSTGCTSTVRWPVKCSGGPVAWGMQPRGVGGGGEWEYGMPSAWRRQCLIKTWSITLIYCLEAGTSKPHRRTAWNHQISAGN